MFGTDVFSIAVIIFIIGILCFILEQLTLYGSVWLHIVSLSLIFLGAISIITSATLGNEVDCSTTHKVVKNGYLSELSGGAILTEVDGKFEYLKFYNKIPAENISYTDSDDVYIEVSRKDNKIGNVLLKYGTPEYKLYIPKDASDESNMFLSELKVREKL